MANSLGPAKFRAGQWVVWSDPDEENVVKPHSGRVSASTVHDGTRIYLIEEPDETGTDGIRLMLALEDELSLLTTH